MINSFVYFAIIIPLIGIFIALVLDRIFAYRRGLKILKEEEERSKKIQELFKNKGFKDEVLRLTKLYSSLPFEAKTQLNSRQMFIVISLQDLNIHVTFNDIRKFLLMEKI